MMDGVSDPSLERYATTAHRAQGATADTAHAIVTSGLGVFRSASSKGDDVSTHLQHEHRELAVQAFTETAAHRFPNT